jgi:hypothetical protein
MMIIVLSMKSQFRHRPSIALFAFAAIFLHASAAVKAPPPAGKATDYTAVETHADEQISIAAEPFDSKEKEAFFHIDYLRYYFLPVRVIITNNSDKALQLSEVRIQFFSANNDKIPAALPEDVERRVDVPRNPSRPGVPLPLPIPLPIKKKSTDKDKQIEADFNTFGFQALAVEPHSTQAGFLFYDVQGLDYPPLKDAHLLLKRLQVADKPGQPAHDLLDFEISFNPYVAAHPKSQ